MKAIKSTLHFSMKSLIALLSGSTMFLAFTLLSAVLSIFVGFIFIVHKVFKLDIYTPKISKMIYQNIFHPISQFIQTSSSMLVFLFGLVRLNYITPSQDIDKLSSYLVISNHLSTFDQLLIQYILNKRSSTLYLFAKYELIFTTLTYGIIGYLLGHIFIKRPSPFWLKYNTRRELSEFNQNILKKNFQLFQDIPRSFLLFPEGSRFTPEKKKTLESPHEYLLPPKIKAMEWMFSGMKKHLPDTSIKCIDFTLVYPDHLLKKPSFLDLLKGNFSVYLNVNVYSLAEITKDCTNSEETEARLKEWIDEVWVKKDQMIKMVREMTGTTFQALDKKKK